MSTTKDDLQAQLFPETDADPINPLATRVPAVVEGGKRGPGRPPGALNTSTKEMRDYLRANFADPLVGRARVSMMRPMDLATALGCTVYEAFQEIEKAKEFLTKYVHQALPQALEIEGGGAVVLNIGIVGSGEAPKAVQGNTVTIAGTLAAPQQDQSLSATQPAQLDAPKLDE